MSLPWGRGQALWLPTRGEGPAGPSEAILPPHLQVSLPYEGEAAQAPRWVTAELVCSTLVKSRAELELLGIPQTFCPDGIQLQCPGPAFHPPQHTSEGHSRLSTDCLLRHLVLLLLSN